MKPTQAALYLRVSSDRQTVESQRVDVERLASARGFEVVQVFEEVESAAKKRPAFEAMKTAARRGEFRVLVIWALDRFGRSTIGNQFDVVELDRVGVQIVSVQEPWLDTSGPMKDLLVAIFSWTAEQERSRLIDRTRAGLARARRQGKRLGRRPREVDLDHALELRSGGLSLRNVAAELGVPTSILHRALSAPPGGLCPACSAEVHVDMHGRARWHAVAEAGLPELLGQGARRGAGLPELLEQGARRGVCGPCAGTGHAALPLPPSSVPKTSPDPAPPAA